MEGAAIEWITDTVLAALERADPVDATGVVRLKGWGWDAGQKWEAATAEAIEKYKPGGANQ